MRATEVFLCAAVIEFIRSERSRMAGLLKRRWLVSALLAAILLGGCDVLSQLEIVTVTPGAAPPTAAVAANGTPGGLPDMPVKPTPKQITFEGCPPEGDGGDPALNLLKNRVDEGDYVPGNFDAIAQLA